MKLEDAYIEIAERSLDASQTMEEKRYFEMAAFQAYHAFESIGGALCESTGTFYPKRHGKKLAAFHTAAKKVGLSHPVSKVAIIVGSVRNRCLYPFSSAKGGYATPKDNFSVTNSKDMRKRVKGVVSAVKKKI